MQTIHRHYSDGGPVDKRQWTDFLQAIRDAGFETRVFDEPGNEDGLGVNDKWEMEMVLPETVRTLQIRSETSEGQYTFGGWTVVRIGEDVEVEVTGITRQSESVAAVEFQYHWHLNKQAEAFLKQLDALEQSVAPFWHGEAFLAKGLPDLEGHSGAAFVLYDDGWRVEELDMKPGRISDTPPDELLWEHIY